MSRIEREYHKKMKRERVEKEKLRIGEMNLIKRSLSGVGEDGRREKK